MGKRETKETYGAIKDDQSGATKDSQNQQGVDTAAREGNNNQATEDRGNLAGTYAGLEGRAPVTSAHTVSNDRFNPIMSGYGDFAANGGWDAGSRDKVGSNVDQLSAIGKTGGIDDASAARFRGLGTYDEFAKTGGYSGGDLANIKAQALSPISAGYQNMKENLATQRNTQGGYAPGFDAASRAMRRDTARGIADTSLNANVMLKDKVNQGRMWGAEGASNSEGNLQSLRTGNMLQGSNAAGNMQINLQDNINKYRMSGLGGQESVARAMSDNDRFNATQETGTDQFNTNNQLDARYRGIAGQQGLYDTSVGLGESARNREVGDVNSRNQVNLGYYGARNPIATQPGVGGNLMKFAGGVAGAAAPLFAGAGGLPGGSTGWNVPNGMRAPM